MIDELIVALQQRVRSGRDVTEGQAPWHHGPYPPVSPSTLSSAESRIGLRLPASLRRLYLEVANGGFGPGYGLLGLAGGAASSHKQTLETEYSLKCRVDPHDPHWRWPAGLLPAFELGCGMFLCVDAKATRGDVVVFEPNPHEDGAPWTDAFFHSPHSLAVWLESWLYGGEMAEQVWLDTMSLKMNHGAAQQGVEADEAGASDGASQLNSGVRRTRGGHLGMTISMLVGPFALLAAGEKPDRCLPRITPDLRKQLAAEYAGHRLPRGNDQDEYNVTYNLQHGGSGCLGVASGDFDGDKQVDTALLLPAESGDLTLVVVALRRGARWTLEQIDEWEGSAARYYVAVAPPGVYESPFYGESPPRPSEQATIKSSTDGVVTGQLESTALYYFRRNGKWQFVWVED